MMKTVDLNSDLGESFGTYRIGNDEAILPHVSSANIACGYHAGDPVTMEQTVRLAKASGIAIGAHPGFPDLMGFGRRNMEASPVEVKAYVKYQLGALMAFAMSYGMKLQHVKPHGAMYNMAAKDTRLAQAIAEAVAEVDGGLVLLGLSNSLMLSAGEAAGLRVASEVFADRAYREDGTLVPRNQPGAVLHDEQMVIRRAIRMVSEGRVTAVTGKDIAMKADSICVHGDNPQAIAFVKNIRVAFESAGIRIAPFGAQEG